MMPLSPVFTRRFCPFLPSHILGHFNPVPLREGGAGGLRPQSHGRIHSIYRDPVFPNPPDPPSLPP